MLMSTKFTPVSAMAQRTLATGALALLYTGYSIGAVGATDTAAEADSLEEVVVTATRRRQDVQKVPISIAAFSAADLAASGVKGIDALAALTPGIEFDQNSAFGSG